MFDLRQYLRENISPPQQVIYSIIIILVIFGLPATIKGCNKEPNYEEMDAVFMKEEARLHDDNYVIEVLDAKTVDKISIKKEKAVEPTEISGYFVAVTVRLRPGINCTNTHILDQNDFKLKDHTGTAIPASDIASLIDLDFPDVTVHSSEFIQSEGTFSTETAIKDYTWIGTNLPREDELIITVYFVMDSDYRVEDTIMIFEADFFVGSGETNKATDIILFNRKESRE